ncbi:hypothetical protein QBC39DRAFT_96516 [Podospora conica]|nr:hypothetical protein QBC39DRAFT_96516 [Schizothecium conicum]
MRPPPGTCLPNSSLHALDLPEGARVKSRPVGSDRITKRATASPVAVTFPFRSRLVPVLCTGFRCLPPGTDELMSPAESTTYVTRYLIVGCDTFAGPTAGYCRRGQFQVGYQSEKEHGVRLEFGCDPPPYSHPLFHYSRRRLVARCHHGSISKVTGPPPSPSSFKVKNDNISRCGGEHHHHPSPPKRNPTTSHETKCPAANAWIPRTVPSSRPVRRRRGPPAAHVVAVPQRPA